MKKRKKKSKKSKNKLVVMSLKSISTNTKSHIKEQSKTLKYSLLKVELEKLMPLLLMMLK
jgi:hypothetical protein